MKMHCDNCEYIGFVGHRQVCGLFLQSGETVFVRDDKISEPCPKVCFERYNQLVKDGKINENTHNKGL